MILTKDTPVVNPERARTISTGHVHGIHCCHLKGNDHNRWCVPCQSSFREFQAEGEEGISLHESFTRFKAAADLHLVETVLGQVEACILPCPPAYENALLDVVDWIEEEDGELAPRLALSA